MGMAHILGEEKAAEPLSHLGPRFPLLSGRDVLFFAYAPEQATEWEREVLDIIDLLVDRLVWALTEARAIARR